MPERLRRELNKYIPLLVMCSLPIVLLALLFLRL